ncbi:MAG: 3-methyl-2-oxobutanoate hydroxymethyltransferase [Vicinamibacterales bacterium]|nr:3-methyl-2-oxobutanoate hydroxymethyltransferase [Vicinamibacterales bacterium]
MSTAPSSEKPRVGRITLAHLQKLKREGERITMVACYDATGAAVVENAGVEIILVGDSLGMLVQGAESTLSVSMEDSIYHTRCVARSARRAVVLGDMPFGSYQESPQQAFANAAKLMAAGSHMIKLEGGALMAETVAFLSTRGIPVCGHLGLTPQSVNALGGYKVQGKTVDAAQRVIDDAKALEAAGAVMIVLEAIPTALGKAVTEAVSIPTIGIGAGPDCSGQILLLYDMLDFFPGRKAKFVKNYLAGAGSIAAAVEAFVREVKDGSFPSPEYCY